MNNEAFEIQKKVRDNSEDLRNALKSLHGWEHDIKRKEKMVKQKPAVCEDLPLARNRSFNAKDKRTPSPDAVHQQPDNRLVSNVQETDQKHPAIDANKEKEAGNQFVKRGDFRQAIACYSRAIKLSEKDPIYYSNRALCYLKLEKFSDCIADCNMATSFDDQCIKAFYRRMQAFEALGEHSKAVQDCRTVLELEPKNCRAKQDLHRIQLHLKPCTTNDATAIATKEPKPIGWSYKGRDSKTIAFTMKAPHIRSKQPLKNIRIKEMVGLPGREQEPEPISDEMVDKLFNNATGECVPAPQEPSQTTDNELSSFFLAPSTSAACRKMFATQKPSRTDKKQDATSPTDKDKNLIILPDVEGIVDTEPQVAAADNSGADKKQVTLAKKLTTGCGGDGVPNNRAIPSQNQSTMRSKCVKNNSIKAIDNRDRLHETKKVEKETDTAIVIPGIPATGVQFCKYWKEFTDEKRFLYLRQMEHLNVAQIIGPNLEGDILSELIFILRQYYAEKNLSVAKTLLELSSHHRINILAYMLSGDDKKYLREMIAIMERNPTEENIAELIAQRFML